jgi:DNA gyrase subunit A
MKLSRLAHLEVEKLEKEKAELEVELARINAILENEELLRKEVETCFKATAAKFGDARRTKIIDICNEDEEPTEIKSLQISLTNQNNIFLNEVSSLYTQKRGGVGNKLKLGKNEYVVSTQSITSNDTILFFTESGTYFHYAAGAIPVGELVCVESLFLIGDNDHICAITSVNKSTKKHIAFVTKEGLIKKSLLSEYNTKRAGGHKALNLDTGDRIVDVLFMDDEDIGVLTAESNFLLTGTTDIRPIGRVARGVKIIKLNEGDCVVSARAIPKGTKEIVSVSAAGLIKKTSFTEFVMQGRATKGAKLQRLTDKDLMADFIPVADEKELLIASNKACIKINLTDVASLSKGAQGSRSMKLATGDKILKMAKF